MHKFSCSSSRAAAVAGILRIARTLREFVPARSVVRAHGGFAFYFWFTPTDPAAPNRAGDFVVTLGGYNPNFDKPAHYPSEPRCGFSWSYDSTISINGAPTSRSRRRRFRRAARSRSTSTTQFEAWFTAHADLIIWFKPFYFILDIALASARRTRRTCSSRA